MKATVNIFITLIVLVILSFKSSANAQLEKIDSLSEYSYISLLTCDPGDQLYSVFGHSAIGVVDPEQKLAVVFNYGTFSFKVAFFYAKFASGKLLYQLSAVPYQRFLREYKYEQRMVNEDILNLSTYQKQRLFDLLKENYKPENRKYQYDFFFDNCATRILDIFYEALDDSLQYIAANNAEIKTHRNLIDECLVDSYWSDLGIDIVLGSVIDRPTTDREKSFLPDYLSEYINNCTVEGKPFVRTSRKLVKESATFKATPWLVRPQLVFWVLFIMVTLLTILFRSKPWVIGDRIVFGVFGILGIIVFLMMFATDHDAAAKNFNIIWAHPLYLVYAWLIGSKHKKALKWASIVILAVNILVLFGWNTIPQMYHIAFIPLIGIIILRSGIIALRYKWA
ncbi:MAG: DUF4105 domain-containing protein [Salinivirgaceae bacterium]|nr:DUF4105 domain-containing protein [Salinivirgaceae bacterium]